MGIEKYKPKLNCLGCLFRIQAIPAVVIVADPMRLEKEICKKMEEKLKVIVDKPEDKLILFPYQKQHVKRLAKDLKLFKNKRRS